MGFMNYDNGSNTEYAGGCRRLFGGLKVMASLEEPWQVEQLHIVVYPQN